MFLAFSDGGSRGNPGDAAIGVVIKKDEEIIYTIGEYIGVETNNVAEYKGLIKSLEILEHLNISQAKIYLDSELVVKQINGIYKVKNIELQKLFVYVISLMKKFERLEIIHVRREFNKEADALVNLALDSKEKGGATVIEEYKNSTDKSQLELTEMSKEYVINYALKDKLELLNRIIKSYGKVAVAYSGGIDSTLLSYVANKVLGEMATSVTIVGEQTITNELDYARSFTGANDIKHKEINISIFDENNYFNNSGERCYHCKKRNFEIIKEYANGIGAVVVDGTNIDDLGEFRPGLKALNELEIKSPFVEAGIRKKEIIELCKYYNLNMDKKESNTCLITRIPVGEKVTKEKLNRINECEAYLKTFIKGTLRLRDYDAYCVIEADGYGDVVEKKSVINDFLNSKGYLRVYLDLGGYKQGNMDERA